MQFSLLSQSGCSWKTWKESSAPSLGETDGKTQQGLRYCSMSLENWKESVISQRGVYSQRQSAVIPSSEKECSSSQNWATPSSRDWKDTPNQSKKRPDGRSRLDQLPRQVFANMSGSIQGQYLNPTWVEQLMGLAPGWTQLSSEWIGLE